MGLVGDKRASYRRTVSTHKDKVVLLVQSKRRPLIHCDRDFVSPSSVAVNERGASVTDN